jgi:hypothetical protein
MSADGEKEVVDTCQKKGPSLIHGVLRIHAEYQQKALIGTKRVHVSETWMITTEPVKGNIVAAVQPASPAVENLPYHYTILTVHDASHPKCPINYFAWNDANIQCGPVEPGSGRVALEAKDGRFHAGMGIISCVIGQLNSPGFAKVVFPRAESNGDGIYMPEMTEQWWDAGKDVSQKRKNLKKRSEAGKIVWRVQSQTEMLVPLRWSLIRMV